MLLVVKIGLYNFGLELFWLYYVVSMINFCSSFQ